VFTEENEIKKIADLTIDWMRREIAAPDNSMAAYTESIVAGYDAGLNTITHGAPPASF
jgi:hypothetical protein